MSRSDAARTGDLCSMRPVTCSNGLFIRTCRFVVKQNRARLGNSTRLKEGNVATRRRCKKFAHLRLATPHVSIRLNTWESAGPRVKWVAIGHLSRGADMDSAPYFPIFIETPNPQLSLSPHYPTTSSMHQSTVTHPQSWADRSMSISIDPFLSFPNRKVVHSDCTAIADLQSAPGGVAGGLLAWPSSLN
jgi:hypothetical protein